MRNAAHSDCVVMTEQPPIPNPEKKMFHGVQFRDLLPCLRGKIQQNVVKPKTAVSRKDSVRTGAHLTVKISVACIKDTEKYNLSDYFEKYGRTETIDVTEDRQSGKKEDLVF